MLVRVFKNRYFDRFARKQGISDDDLCEAIDRAARGLTDANLGGGVIKQRVARPNEGNSGAFAQSYCSGTSIEPYSLSVLQRMKREISVLLNSKSIRN